jgi:hypothetical protein
MPMTEADWNTGTVRRLAEAGCGDAELLGHLRSTGPHYRGCWAVDLILGRS